MMRVSRIGGALLIAALIGISAPNTFSDTINGTGWKGTAGNNNWSSAGNWDSNPPTTNASNERSLFFGQGYKAAGGAGSTTANNDLTNWAGYRITFQDSNAAGNGTDGSSANDTAFTITGNGFTLFDFGSGNFPRIENDSFLTQTFNLTAGQTITLSGGSNNFAEIDPVNGDLVFSSGTKIDLAGSTQLRIFGNNGKTVTFGGVISSSGNSGNNSVAINQNSTVVYNAANTYAGDTFINAGKLQFGAGGSANSSTIRLGDTSGTANAELDLLTTTGGVTIASTINPRAGSSGTLTIASQNTSGTNTLSGHIGVDKNFTISQAAGGTLAITQGRSTASGTSAGFDIKTFTVTFTGAGNFAIGPASPTGFGTIYDSVSGGSGTAIIMNGTGSLSLNDANSYRGTTVVNSGTLLVGANNALGSSNGTIGTTGNIVLLGNTSGSSNASLLTTGAFTIANAITLQSGNTGTITLGGNTAAASIYSGAINLGTASGIAKNGTFVALSGGSVDFQGVINESTSVPDSSVVIGDSTHSGTVKFSGINNGYGGSTTITNGAILEVVDLTSGNSSIGNSSSATASNLVLSNGTLKYTGAGETTARSFTFDANGGALDASGSGTISFNGTASASGSGNRTLTLTGTNTGINTLASVLADPGSGTTALVKNGGGTWVLSGLNTYSGGTTVSNGLLQLNSSTALGSTNGALQVDAVLNLNGNNAGVGNLSGSSTGKIWNNTVNNAVTFTVGNGNNGGGTYAGVIADNNGGSSGTVALTKTGSGTITLSGSNSYTGATTVNGGGSLFINGNQSAATGAVTVSGSGTTLGGSGTIGGSVTLNAGSISNNNLSPGATGVGSVATLSTGALTLTNNTNLNIDITGAGGVPNAGGTYDQLSVTGTVTLQLLTNQGNLVVSASNLTAANVGQAFFILANDSTDAVTGTFAQGTTVTSGSDVFTIDYVADFATGGLLGGNDIALVLTAVPEPSTWISAVFALGAIGYSQRKRFRKLF